jgi:three-Cys-motif partner protein
MADEYATREQSGLKHFVLRRYLEAATRIIGGYKDIAYVDCCAGPWQSQKSDRSDTSFGIAIDVLRKASEELQKRGKRPRFKALLIEQDASAFSQLKDFTTSMSRPEVSVEAQNWDFTGHVGDIVRFAEGPKSFSFVFVDPKGWSLAEHKLLEPILRIEPGEVLINFMSSFVNRFVMDGRSDFTNLLGADFAQVADLQGDEREDEIVRRYCEAIRQVGKFKYVCALPVMNPQQDAFQFHLIYATRHTKGVEVFKAVEKNAEEETTKVRANVQHRKRQLRGASGELFAPEVLYREQRYKRLAKKNAALAQAALWRLIRSGETVSYDDCWAEALQFATVRQEHLREWLSDAERNGVISCHGRKNSKEVLKIASRHTIQLLESVQ